MKLGAQTFSPISGVLAIVDRSFMKIVAPPSDENENSLVLLKGQTIPKEMVKTASESTHKPRYNISFKLSPTRRQTKHIFAPYSRRAYIDLHQTVQGDRGRRDNSKR